MNNHTWRTGFLAIFVSFSCVCFGVDINPEYLAKLLRSQDTRKSSEDVKEIALSNLDALAGVLTIPNGDGLARLNALSLLQAASFEGILPHDQFFLIVAKQLAAFEMFSRQKTRAFESNLFSNSIVFHGYAPGGQTSLPFATNLENLKLVVIALAKFDLVIMPVSRCNDFILQVSTLVNDKNPKEAISLLQQFIEARDKDQINPVGKKVLLGYLRNLVSQLETSLAQDQR